MRTNDRTSTRVFAGAIDGGRFRTEHSEQERHQATRVPPKRTPRAQTSDEAQARPRPTRQRRAAGKPVIRTASNNARTTPPYRNDTVIFPRNSKRRLHARLMVGVILCAGLAFVLIPPAAHFVTSTFLGQAGTADPARQEESARSTPKSEWKKGSIPFLYQIDPQWAGEPYAGETIRVSGCGPTCLSMAYVALTGRTDLNPVAMARFSEDNGFVTDGLTAWALMTDGAAKLGLRSEEIAADPSVVSDVLSLGSPIICSVRPGDFTTTGHFIVLAGINEEGRVIVHDPNSSARSSVAWDLQQVLDQCANLWAFSEA